jgi:uncharacterized protein (TIGR00299 family) protein
MIGGASGNMLLGALIDAGAPVAQIEAALLTIPVSGWTSESRRVEKRGIAATYFDFIVPGEDHHAHEHAGAHGHGRHLAEVLDIIERSGLSRPQVARARAIYVRLAEAEAKVHGTTADRIHFHEVGATDAILDVAGACVALDLLGIERVFCSAFPIGRGSIDMQHGRYPNPPPATAELLLGAPTYDADVAGEMVTTTAAAILTHLVERPGVRPAMIASAIGYGAGRSDFTIPNVLRATVGVLAANASIGVSARLARPVNVRDAVEVLVRTDGSVHDDVGVIVRDETGGIVYDGVAAVAPDERDGIRHDEVAVLEANVDDMSPQRFELALERTLAAGAFDVWLAPVTMKKSRPAILFGAIGPLEREAAIARTMLAETTTLGVRVRRERRYTLERSLQTVATPLGPVRVKTAFLDGQARPTLEYDDLARIARERQRPLAEIVRQVEEFLRDGG